MRKLILLILLCIGSFAGYSQTYCTPTFSYAYGSCSYYGMRVGSFNATGVSSSISDAAACNGSGYLDKTSLSCTMYMGGTYAVTVNTPGGYSCSGQIWIDFNYDGTFDASESVGGFTSGTGNHIFNITLAGGVYPGNRRMRVAVNDANYGGAHYPSINPCGGYYYGEDRDYTINVATPPPTASLTPSSRAFGAVLAGSTSGTLNTVLSASYLSTSTGNLTVTAPSNFEVYNGSAWVSSYTISFSGAGVSAATIPIHFVAPASAGSYSGSVCVSGGGLSSAVCASVSGTSAAVCSGTPTAGTGSVSPTTGSTGTTFTLSTTGYTSAGSITFQWQSSASAGGTYTNITGATTSSYSFSGMTSNTYYRCLVTCTASGSSATTSPVLATWAIPASSCTPAFANACSSYPMTTSIKNLVGATGSITDNTACTGSSYEDYSASMTCTLYQSLSYTATLNTSTTYYSSFNEQVWIDFNDNGTFETSESVGGNGYSSTPTPTAVLAIPATAAVGLHRMRIVGNYQCCGASAYPSMNPCPTSAISYGDCRDYSVTIAAPPPMASLAPTTLNFGTIGTSSTSASQATVLNAAFLTASSGTLTVTASANYEVCATAGGTYTSSYTISYSGSAVSANSVYVHFVAPGTPGTYTGTVCVSGGGLSSAVCASLTGVSANACSGTPTPGTASVSAPTGTSSSSFTFSLSGTSIGLGLTYQWQSATTSGGTYSNITGATNATYTVSGLTSATYFKCVVGCTYSGASAASNVVGVAIYCLPAFANPCSSYPMSGSIGTLIGTTGTISDGSACTSTSYENMTSLSCSLTGGVTYNVSLAMSGSYYSSLHTQFWIDYNDDGTFATSESVGGGGAFSSSSPVVTIAIPTTATVGTHIMREVTNYQCCGGAAYPSINPCPTTSISYGDARDYKIIILPPPPAATLAPTSIAFSPTTTGTSSSTTNLILNASYLTPASSSLTVVSSNTNFQVYSGSAWVSSYTIAYTGATVAAGTIPVRFTPGSAGSFSGTICVTGGGLSSAVCASVTGTGASICSGTPTAGTASCSPTTGAAATTFTLTCSGYTAAGGISFQWQSASTSGGTYTNISGATLATYSFSGLASTTYYKCVVTCSASGSSATTAFTTATWVLPASSCTPAFANPCSSYPMNCSIKSLIGGSGSISDVTGCTSASYEDYTGSLTCTLFRSLTYTVTENLTTSYYSSFTTQLWIDFNDNGTFETSESMGGINFPTTATPTFNMTVPSTATPGLHRMRIVGNYGCCGYSSYPSVNPCPTSAISYGDARDYTVTIQDPPPYGSTTPSSLNFGTIATSTTSSALNTVLTAAYLTPATGTVTVTAPSNYQVCSTAGGTYATSYTISYSASTITSNSIYVKFVAPSTAGVYSGNVTVTGGGLGAAINTAVTGIGANACSGTPSGGTAASSPVAGTSATTFNLSLSGATIVGLGLSYQWQSATSAGGTYTNITGATNTTYSVSGLTSARWFQCVVTCSYSGASATSSNVGCAVYCLPTFANACSSFPMNASIGTLNGYSGTITDATSCTSTSYEDMTSLSCTLRAGSTYSPTLNLTTSYYPSFGVQVWIDYNDDGTFSSSESIGGGSSFSTYLPVISLTLPATATPGTHRMRLVGNYAVCCGGAAYPSVNPCPTTAISYGDARDYTVNVIPPPPAATVAPTSISFSPTLVGSSSATTNVILNATYLTPSTGALTVTSSNSNFEMYNGSAWVSTSYSISYSAATVSAGTIPVRFTPGSTGTFSGTICVSGGGLASAVCASVNGTGATACSGTPTAGTAAVSPTTGAASTAFTLTCTGYTASGGIGFQWEYRNPSGSGTWTTLAGATLSTYTFTGITSSTDYRCVVTCSYSGSSATTSPVTATWVLPASSCTPTFANACSSFPMTTSVKLLVGGSGSIVDNNACTGSSYIDYSSSIGCTLYRSISYTVTENVSTTYYTSFGTQFWIDYNDNGTFESSESMGGNAYGSISTSTPTFSMTVPSGAALGMHRARIVGNYAACCGGAGYPSVNPCPTTAISYGDARDYYVIIQNPPPMSSATPTSLSFGTIAASTTSTAQSTVVTGSFLTPSTDALTVTAPTNFSVCSTSGGTYVSSYAISYSSATVAATSVFVKFNAPSTVGAYSGNVVLSGGGLTPLNIPVTGTSANACSGTPTAGTTVTTPSAGTSATSFTLSLSGSSIGLGLTYQWMQSTTGSSAWTNITGATNATYTFSGLTSSMYYYCLVTCTYSGLNQYSSVARISNYCVPAFANPCSSYPMSGSIGTLVGVSGSISDGTACTSTSYEDRTSLSCSITAGVTYNVTLAMSGSYFGSLHTQFWIDYNDDGTFAASESIGGGGSFGTSAPVITIATPSSATLGSHMMREVTNYQCCGGAAYPSINPCPTTAISYGDARDYRINILPPPPAATLTPTSISFSPTTTGTSSATSTLTLNASYLTPAASNLTVTSSSSAFEVYNGSAWVSSYTIAYTGATVSAGTIGVRFSPASAGSFSGTICVSGGGLASAVCSSVNGTGASPCSGTPTSGTAAVSPTTGSGGTTFTLTCSGYSASGGIGFQWQSSAAGAGSWSNITGATLATYSFTGISSSTDYRCIVTCSYSGVSANTNTTTATWALPASSCTPTYGSASAACSSYSMYAQFAVTGTSGSIADASACSGSGWEDLTSSTSVGFLRGNTFTSTITTGGTYYSSMVSQIWIDYNDDGSFASSESVGGYNYFATPAQAVSITIPSTATPGYHRMRVQVQYACCGFSAYPSMNPCPTTAISYGDCRDYKVNVIAPVACSGTPTAGAVSATPTTGCSPVSTSMYPTAAVGVTGLTYQWQSSATSGGTYTAISGATNYTYAPSVATNTYYNCVLTCTASGGSATSSNQLITANPSGGAFSGTPSACSGSTSTLSNAVSGGTWSSSNTAIATVNPTTGVVTGGAPGTCSILYTTSGCTAVSTTWTTNAAPGTITGTANACVGATSTLANSTPGGTWTSSDTTIARVVTATTTTGTVTGMSAGTCTITYSTGCGSAATVTFTTNSTPSAIIGLSSVCTASVNNFSNTVSGGTWSVSGSATGTTISATTGDLYTATTVGTETVTYAIGSCSTTMTVAVGSSGPSSITGATSVCATATTTLTDAISGGAWTSSNPSIASIGFGTGVVTGMTSGTVTITYSTGCGSPVTASMTVNGSAVSISSATVCSGGTLSLTANTTGSGSFTYSWSGPLSFTSTSATATIGSAATNRSGIYSVSATQSGCTTSTSYWASVDTTPVVSVSATPASICPGGTSNLSVSVTSPASGSTNYTVMAIPYTPYTLTSSTAGPSGDDVASSATIPFSFNYYGTAYSTISICTNGFISIGGSSASYTVASFPTSAVPGAIALFWHDLNGSGITYGTIGTTPNRKFVVNYNNYGDFSGGAPNTGQIVLYETSNVIEMFISKANTASTYNMVCGIQNPGYSLSTTVPGQNNVNYTINNTVAGTAWRFERPVYSYTWTPGSSLSATNIANPVSTGITSTTVYTVTSVDANSGCTAGNVSTNTVNVYTPPTAYTVAPATGCTAGTTITLPNSQATATYQLYRGATPVGSPVTGTGSSISFGTMTVTGTYTIVATLITGGCQTTMTGSCIIYNSPNTYTMTGGSGCSYSGVTIGLSGSDVGVNYQLYLGASAVGSPVAGTASAISFGTVYGAGSYSVVGTATAGGCQTTMTGSSTIAVSPVAYSVTGGNGCTAAGVTVGTSNSETGVSYQMYKNSVVSGSPVTGSTGTGVTFGTQYTTGAYTVLASVGGCNVWQTGADTVNTTPSITLGANPSLCQPATSANISFSSPTGSPTTYSITWGSAAITDGFSNVSGATLSGSAIALTIPSTSIAGVYTGTITVSNGPCSSTSYGFTLTLYAVPAGSITSAVPPCSGYSTSIVFTGTSGATVSYQINHGSIINATLTGGTYTLTTGALTTATTYTLYDVHNPVCSDSINIDTVINPIPMTWVGGTTGVETEWNTTTNWSCGFIPTATDNVIIPSGTTYSPVIAASASGTANNITIASGATVAIGNGGNLNIKGNMTHSGSITGAGSVVLNSSAGSQTISGIGSVNNFELNNPSGATVSVASRFTIKGVATITAGTLATGDSVVFYSDSFGTARLAPVPASGSAITGNVKVTQWIPGGRRAYRFWAHPFSNYIGLDQIQNYIDVTGAGGASNGFTTTASNAPSAFRYDPLFGNSAAASDPGWRPFTSAYVTADSNRIHQYQGIRLYFRGAKGEGLGYGAYVPSSTTVAQSGVLNQGTQTVVLAKGSAANQEYNMVGNPYASPVDIGTSVFNAKVAGAVTGAAYYIWNPFLGSAGQFQAQAIPSVTAVPYYLQANACFQVRAAYNAATMTFTESMKNATSTTSVLKASPDYVALTIYDANYHPWDMLNIKFNDDATNEEDGNYDATKPNSPADLNFYSLSADNKKLTIDGRPYQAESAIPLGIQSNIAQDFIIKSENVALPEGGKVYLHDKLLKQFVLLQQGTEYRFSISSDKQTQGEQRFELSMAPSTVANNKGLQVTMTPNPATDEVTIGFTNGKAEAVSVRVLDLSGVSVYNQNIGTKQNGSISVQLSNFAAGVYMVELTSGDQKVVQRLIKE